MYTKKILSVAAAVAVMSTGAMAFDTNASGGLAKENGDNTITKGTYTRTAPAVTSVIPNIAASNAGVDINVTDGNTTYKFQAMQIGNPAKNLGDALIFPAFFSTNGWQSEFTVVNTSRNAVIAKVVLYSYEDSKELKDFNIYLSANDVFRAKIKDGVITSTDDSTVVSATTSGSQANGFIDKAVMASEDTPFTTDLGEGTGYISVYAMLEVNGTSANRNGALANDGVIFNKAETTLSIPNRLTDGYDKEHAVLWADYRKLLDQCRPNWRGNLTGGIYAESGASGQVAVPHLQIRGNARCNLITSTRDKNGNSISDANVSFRAPTETLSGSILVGTDDAAGSRNMLLPATPIVGFSEENSTVIWTEGEFASIADRCIDRNNTTKIGAAGLSKAPDVIGYNHECIEADMNQTLTLGALYEFSNKSNSSLLMTQPHKRTRIQLANVTFGTVDAWRGITRDTTSKLVTFYGGFRLNMDIYDDSENVFVNSGAGFIVSPATTASSTIPNEMSMMTNILDASPYDAGWARVMFTRDNNQRGIPAIVTQMSASMIGDNPETNWIYPFVRSNAQVTTPAILNNRP